MGKNLRHGKVSKRSLAYALGIAGSIASIIGLALVVSPTAEDSIAPAQRSAEHEAESSKSEPPPSVQVQTGRNNMQAGRDVIVNRYGESSGEEGVFLYEEKIEIYWNDWWAHPLRSREHVARVRQAEVAITGEGKTVDFSGVISMNCENGKYFWKSASNFRRPLVDKQAIEDKVPDQIHRNVYKLFCRER